MKHLVSFGALLLALTNGLFLLGNGTFMLVAPDTWYISIPGVTTTGLFNQHFIRDIGIIQFFLGLGFWIGVYRPARRLGAWGIATSWLIAHALFHVWEVSVGICGPSALARDFPAVSLPAIVGLAVTTWAFCTRELRTDQAPGKPTSPFAASTAHSAIEV